MDQKDGSEATCTDLAENPSSVISIHIRLTIICNSRFRGSSALFWLPWVPALSCTYPPYGYICIIKNKL